MANMATKPILYSYFRSSASWRVRIVLAWKNIEYEYRAVNLIKDGGQQHTDEYRSINPMGQVPALVIGENTLTQSLAIIDYLEDVYPEPSIVPRDPIKKAQARALAELIASGTQPIQNLSVLQKVSDNPDERATWAQHWIDKGFTESRALGELIAAGTQPMTNSSVTKYLYEEDEARKQQWMQFWIDKGFTAYEKMVQSTAGKYSVGDIITIADVCLVPQLYNAQRFKVDMSKFPTVMRIIDACSELPAFKAADPHVQPDCPEDLRKH